MLDFFRLHFMEQRILLSSCVRAGDSWNNLPKSVFCHVPELCCFLPRQTLVQGSLKKKHQDTCNISHRHEITSHTFSHWHIDNSPIKLDSIICPILKMRAEAGFPKNTFHSSFQTQKNLSELYPNKSSRGEAKWDKCMQTPAFHFYLPL